MVLVLCATVWGRGGGSCCPSTPCPLVLGRQCTIGRRRACSAPSGAADGHGLQEKHRLQRARNGASQSHRLATDNSQRLTTRAHLPPNVLQTTVALFAAALWPAAQAFPAAFRRRAQNFTARYFVPDDVPFDDLGIISFGMYANDLAWMGPATTSEAYAERSASHNVLQLVWRMAWDTDRGCLVPTWPVVALGQDLRLCNKEPMEVGIQYGWRYWDALVKQGKSAGGIVA